MQCSYKGSSSLADTWHFNSALNPQRLLGDKVTLKELRKEYSKYPCRGFLFFNNFPLPELRNFLKKFFLYRGGYTGLFK